MKILRLPIFYGIIFALLTLTLAAVINKSFAIKLSGITGGGLLFLACIFSGSLVSGDRMRANYSTETTGDREERFNLVGTFLKLGLPSVALCIILYFLP